MSKPLADEFVDKLDKAIHDWLADPWKYAEDHRKGISDIGWARMQPKEQSFYIGDVVEFKVGGFGVIDGVSEAQGGWPPSYSTEKVKGLQDRKDTKRAWHYEGDFLRLVAPSGIRAALSANQELTGGAAVQ